MDALLYDLNGGVATLTLNRPDALNAVDATLGDALIKTLESVAGDNQVRCVVITGNGKGFCAGAELNQFTEAFDAGIVPPMAEVIRARYNRIIEPITTMEKPVVAGLNGVAAGMGTSLALACDYRIASDKARFTAAFSKIAVIPDSGLSYFLPRLVGLAKAMELTLLSPVIDAAEMLRIGLTNEVVPADQLGTRLSEFAGMLAKGPTRAYGLTKKVLQFGEQYSLADTLDLEADLQQQIASTYDMREGIQAFLDKRTANYEGR